LHNNSFVSEFSGEKLYFSIFYAFLFFSKDSKTYLFIYINFGSQHSAAGQQLLFVRTIQVGN
jgi:hypothetical protein